MDARTIPFCLLVVVLIGSAARSQESKPWWNPFSTSNSAGNSSVRDSSYFDNKSKRSSSEPLLALPKLPWASGGKAPGKAASSSPSVFHRMSRSTKSAWKSTVDFLNPFDSSPPAPVQQGYQPQNAKPKSEGSMFGWMWREEKSDSPGSVNEFLRQERPKF